MGSSLQPLPAALLAEALFKATHHDHWCLRVDLTNLVSPVVLSAAAEIGVAPVDEARGDLGAVARRSCPL